jgi:hemolysin activation/secretion protein
LLLVSGMVMSGFQEARADAVTDVFFEELRRKDQREEEQRRRDAAPDVRLQPEMPPLDEALPRESVCFSILSIKLDGLPPARFTWAQPLVDRFVGQCVGVEGINVLVKRLQAEFIARGYITTRVVVPKQDLTSAVLMLHIVPGVVRDIRFADDEGRGSWFTAFPTGPGELLNLRDLEQGLEQMKRMPSQDIEMDIAPGVQPGESDVVIKRKPEKPWRAILSLDDSGSDATGKWQGAATFAWDDPFGINDLFNLSINTNAERDNKPNGARGNSLYYSFPFGYWTVSVSASEYEYRQTVEGINQTFLTSGETTQYDIRVQRGLFRTAKSKTGLQFRVSKKKSRNFIEDVEIDVQRRDVTAAEWTLQHRQYLGAATLDIAWAYRYGVPWWNAQDEPENPSPTAPTTRYRLQTLDAGLALPFSLWDRKLRYGATIRAQASEDYLYGSEFFAIGNRYTVRGFDGEQTLAAERGAYIRNELGFSLWESGQEIYIGIDYGRVGGPSAGSLSGRHLAGSVLGLRGRYKKDFQYDASAGWAQSKPDTFETGRPAYAVQLNYQY